MQNYGRQHGGTRLPIWRDANRLLVEIETAVRAFPRSHRDTVGSDLRVLAMRVCGLLSLALAATGAQRLGYMRQLLDTVGDLKVHIQFAKIRLRYTRKEAFMHLRPLTIALLCTFVACAGAEAQTCRSENEIPSTTPTRRFLVHGDATVTDTATGLMWARCPEGLSGASCDSGNAATFTWEGALVRARDSSLAGYTDWRLPNVKELSSLFEEQCYNPAINLAVFPNTPASLGFWSASPGALSPSFAWFAEFGFGSADHYDGRSDGNHVRLVRSGQ